jgi:conjugative transfer signal peptidase TraF
MTTIGLFDRARRFNGLSARRGVGLATVVFVTPFFALGMARLRINATPSLPMGLYRETNDGRAALVEFCPQEPYGSFAAARGYRSVGNCPDGAGPLMKPVVASAGDLVEVSGRGIAVNGVLLPNTAPRSMDSKGRPMQSWSQGQYRVPAGFVWVASSYNPWSFDSRYFGPIPITLIRSRLKPFLTL